MGGFWWSHLFDRLQNVILNEELSEVRRLILTCGNGKGGITAELYERRTPLPFFHRVRERLRREMSRACV